MPKIMGFGFRTSGLGLRVSVVFIRTRKPDALNPISTNHLKRNTPHPK